LLLVAALTIVFMIWSKGFLFHIISLAGIFISGMFFSILYSKAFHKRKYAVREHDIIYQRGLLSNHVTIVPFSRIQHVAVYESFLARKLKLAQIQIFTAGGTAGTLKISGLEKENAEKIKAVILGKITSGEENDDTAQYIADEENETNNPHDEQNNHSQAE